MSLGYVLTPFTSNLANHPALTVERWRTCSWQTETTFSEIATQSPGLSLGSAYFFSREATSSPKEILWVFTGIRAYLIPSTSSIFSFFIAEMVPRERGRTPKAD